MPTEPDPAGTRQAAAHGRVQKDRFAATSTTAGTAQLPGAKLLRETLQRLSTSCRRQSCTGAGIAAGALEMPVPGAPEHLQPASGAKSTGPRALSSTAWPSAVRRDEVQASRPTSLIQPLHAWGSSAPAALWPSPSRPGRDGASGRQSTTSLAVTNRAEPVTGAAAARRTRPGSPENPLTEASGGPPGQLQSTCLKTAAPLLRPERRPRGRLVHQPVSRAILRSGVWAGPRDRPRHTLRGAGEAATSTHAMLPSPRLDQQMKNDEQPGTGRPLCGGRRPCLKRPYATRFVPSAWGKTPKNQKPAGRRETDLRNEWLRPAQTLRLPVVVQPDQGINYCCIEAQLAPAAGVLPPCLPRAIGASTRGKTR